MEVNFIVVDTYSPYTAIVGRPWLHTLGAVAPPEGKVPIRRSGPQDPRLPTHGKAVMVAAISHQPDAESSALEEKDL